MIHQSHYQFKETTNTFWLLAHPQVTNGLNLNSAKVQSFRMPRSSPFMSLKASISLEKKWKYLWLSPKQELSTYETFKIVSVWFRYPNDLILGNLKSRVSCGLPTRTSLEQGPQFAVLNLKNSLQSYENRKSSKYVFFFERNGLRFYIFLSRCLLVTIKL